MNCQNITLLNAKRIESLKAPFSTRRVPHSAFATLLAGDLAPRAGDLVLCRVEKIGQHRHLELISGRRAKLYPGDEIVLAYGNRYAPDQFESQVPEDLGRCQMVAAGGIASMVMSKHGRMKNATLVQPLGLVGDRHGKPLNLADFALPEPAPQTACPFVISVLGTSMNAGKTETAAQIIRGLRAAGLRVGAAKVTGTGSGGDVWSMNDAGAETVLDFTDAGLPSTYLADGEEVIRVMHTLIGYLGASGVDVVVFEVADGLFQRETAELVKSPEYADAVDAVVFAAGDAMGSAGGVQWLRSLGLPVMAASGVLTASPLATREAAAVTGLPVLGLEELSDASIATHLGVEARQALLQVGGVQ